MKKDAIVSGRVTQSQKDFLKSNNISVGDIVEYYCNINMDQLEKKRAELLNVSEKIVDTRLNLDELLSKRKDLIYEIDILEKEKK